MNINRHMNIILTRSKSYYFIYFTPLHFTSLHWPYFHFSPLLSSPLLSSDHFQSNCHRMDNDPIPPAFPSLLFPSLLLSSPLLSSDHFQSNCHRMDNDPIPPAFPSLPFPSILFSSLPFSSLLLPSLSFSSLLFSVPIHRLAHILSQFTSSHLFFYFQSFIIHFSSLLFHSYLFFHSCTEPTAISFLPYFLHSVPPSFLPHCNVMCHVVSRPAMSCPVT